MTTAASAKGSKTSGGPLVVGVDLGGTNMQFGVVDASGGIIGRAKMKTKSDEGPDAVVERLVDGVRSACSKAKITLDDIGAIGVAAAGAMDIPRGVILDAPNLRWYDLPLRDIVARKTGRPVVLENDVNAAVWGEYQLGAAKGEGDVLGVWVGTGVGGGLVLNGRIYHGAFFTAGEVGHTVLDIHEPTGTAKLEEICSRTGMSRTILHRLHAYPDSVLNDEIDTRRGVAGSKVLARAYEAGDALTVDVVDHAADLLGIFVSNMVTVLSLDLVIIGGGVTEALGEAFLERIRRSFRAHVFPDVCRNCRIEATVLEDNAGLLGAALLAQDAIR